MKKVLWSVLALMMALAACEGPMGPVGPPGPMGPTGKTGESTQWKIYECDILSEHWVPAFDDLMGPYFEFEFPIPELTKFVFEEGAVVCYRIQNVNYGGRNILVQTPLPYTFYGDDDGYYYSENYTYEIRTGYINFIVKVSDFDTSAQQPLDSTFRVVLMW